jgi:hypothetical protein
VYVCQREGEIECVSERGRERESVCQRGRDRESVRERERQRVCVREGETGREYVGAGGRVRGGLHHHSLSLSLAPLPPLPPLRAIHYARESALVVRSQCKGRELALVRDFASCKCVCARVCVRVCAGRRVWGGLHHHSLSFSPLLHTNTLLCVHVCVHVCRQTSRGWGAHHSLSPPLSCVRVCAGG